MNDTILVVDASDKSAVEWTKPDDFTPDPKDPIKGLPGHHPRDLTRRGPTVRSTSSARRSTRRRYRPCSRGTATSRST